MSKEKDKLTYKVILHKKSKHKHINKMELIDENETIYSDCYSGSDCDSSDEEFTMKPLRKAMKLIRNELDSTILTMVSVKDSLEKKSKQSVKDILNNTFLEKVIDSEVKGIDVYDFIIKNI